MARATYQGIVLAESDRTEQVDGNAYFPPEAIARDYFTDSPTHTTCGWKGVASYYNLAVNGETIRDVAWYYPTPKDAAKQITGYVAFYKNKGVVIEA